MSAFGELSAGAAPLSGVRVADFSWIIAGAYGDAAPRADGG